MAPICIILSSANIAVIFLLLAFLKHLITFFGYKMIKHNRLKAFTYNYKEYCLAVVFYRFILLYHLFFLSESLCFTSLSYHFAYLLRAIATPIVTKKSFICIVFTRLEALKTGRTRGYTP